MVAVPLEARRLELYTRDVAGDGVQDADRKGNQRLDGLPWAGSPGAQRRGEALEHGVDPDAHGRSGAVDRCHEPVRGVTGTGVVLGLPGHHEPIL